VATPVARDDVAVCAPHRGGGPHLIWRWRSAGRFRGGLHGFGWPTPTGRPVDDATAFYIASTTKALTATAVLLEVSKGAIGLTTTTAMSRPPIPRPMDAHRVTVRQLLTMTDGLADGGPVVTRTAYTGDFTIPVLIRLLADYGPDPDGTAFSYDILPYNILGLALDPRSEEGWKDVVRRDVLDPLGMRETSARISTMDPARLALPHELTPGEGWRRAPLAKEDANQHAAGGHFATARDLARFVAAHASGGFLRLTPGVPGLRYRRDPREARRPGPRVRSVSSLRLGLRLGPRHL
jgi:CubicO group peptidase (beta-lactamase class C family)